MELRVAKSALDDLRAIQEHYAELDVPHIGDGFIAAILEHFEMLALHPDAGRVVPEFSLPHIREVIHAPFRVVYLREVEPGETGGAVTLIRVWRSERQLKLPGDEA